MKWIRRHKRKLLFSFAGLLIVMVAGGYGGVEYFKSGFFSERPNTLSIQGELRVVPFRWVSQKFGSDYSEPHSAILIPVTVPGLDNPFYMQFDTGCQTTFLRSGCLEQIHERGVECDLFELNGQPYVRNFELSVAGNQVVLEPGRVMRRDISIDWENPDAINIIGSIGTDFLDNVV